MIYLASFTYNTLRSYAAVPKCIVRGPAVHGKYSKLIINVVHSHDPDEFYEMTCATAKPKRIM